MYCISQISHFKKVYIITARKRSLRRLCFHTGLSVILFTRGRVVPGQVPLRAGTPQQVNTCPWQVPPGRHTPLAGTPPGQVPPWAGTPLQAGTPPGSYTPWQVQPPWQVHPLGHSAYWDTVNKRAVCIPLECILVSFDFTICYFSPPVIHTSKWCNSLKQIM